MLDDSSQQALLKQAKPRLSLRPPSSPSPSVFAGERSSRFDLKYSTVSSRAGGQVHGQAPEEPAKVG
ncbi:hypothetical protein HU200_063345 [Digitaria exilis]|uniref:Uncharacterized protein n=1 Tax=Digitaria exilis TaxID=1010633 RepID=A0A835A3W0_9POAL|nr:hypothetical protein HU200_063345 [Digitaria exilis]